MTDATLNELLRSIIAHPDEDSVRLVYADRLQELGDEERAEFIRVQVELKQGWPILSEFEVGDDTNNITASPRFFVLKRREGELLEIRNKMGERNFCSWFTGFPSASLCGWNYTFTRGFISSVTCTAEDFLKYADQLIWNEKMTDECPKCQNPETAAGYGWFNEYGITCQHCQDKQRIPRSCPDSAQPIREVVLTSHPQFEVQWQQKAIKLTDRQMSWAWDGVHGPDSAKYCLSKEFPGIEFELPPLEIRTANRREWVEAGADIVVNQLITADDSGRGVPVGSVPGNRWIIGRALNAAKRGELVRLELAGEVPTRSEIGTYAFPEDRSDNE